MANISVFDKSLNKIAELRGDCARSWILNGTGQLRLEISKNDINVREEVLRFGNYLYVDHPTLPPWAGIIEPPRSWSPKSLIIAAYEIPRILKYRRGAQNQLLTGKAGNIFQQLINYANSQADTGIIIGTVEYNDIDRQQTMNLGSIYDEITQLVGRAGNDWDVIPQIDSGGKLAFTANYYSRKGSVIDIPIIEGGNLIENDTMLTEQGLLVNDVAGYGDGADWATKPVSIIRNEDSINTYGLRQHSRNFQGCTDPATVKRNTLEYVSIYSTPRTKILVDVNNSNNIFPYLRCGNTFRVMLSSSGFKGTGFGFEALMRISSMSYNDNNNVVSLVGVEDDEEESYG